MDLSDRNLQDVEELLQQRSQLINESIIIHNDDTLKPRLRDRLRRLKLLRLMRIEKTLARVRRHNPFKS
ncbi:MAG: hypothetical protein R2827_01590 [Bdellovibrionales bacterium]